MALTIGRKAAIGLGKETTRGTSPSAPSVWIPWVTMSFDDMVESIVDESAYGRLEDTANADVVETYADGNLEGNAGSITLGYLLENTFGSVSGERSSVDTTYWDHTFTVDSDNPLTQSYTYFLTDGIQDYAYSNGMVSSLTITAAIGQYLGVSGSLMAKKGVKVSGLTPSTTAEKIFIPKEISVEYPDGTPKPVTSFSLQVDKNTVKDLTLGEDTPQDFLATMFTVTGSLDILIEDESFKEQMLANMKRGMAFKAIGDSPSKDSIVVSMDRVQIMDYTKNYEKDGITSATISYKALYDVSNAKMIEVLLRNTKTTAY